MYSGLKVMLCCIALAGTIGTTSFISYAKNDNIPVTETTDDTPDYEEILSPYQDVFNEFNNTHGTKYGFMTDEQLNSHNMNREEYLKEMVDTYSGMTYEEFYNVLEEAYINDVSADKQKPHAENLPYYKRKTTGNSLRVHRVPDKNGGFTFLNEQKTEIPS